MVAHMADLVETTAINEGNGDSSPSDLKDNPSESSHSSSESTSTEESSEEEEAHEEEEHTDPDSDVKSRAENRIDVSLQSCCEKCRALKNPEYELVTPRKLFREQKLQLQLDAEGLYECSETGLVFEVSQCVRITYCVLSWSKFSSYLTESWKFAGPIFDVNCDPSILKSIQFPHSLCLADKDNEVTFSVLHVKGSHGLIEPSDDHSGSHVKWSVSSLSPVGPVVKTSRSAEHHGVVQVFKEVGLESSFSFRVYLAGNNCSDINDIRKAIQRANKCKNNKKYILVDKPPTCMLEENRRYRLSSEPMGHITPEDMLFSPVIVEVKGYFEVFFEDSPPFKLSLMDTDSGQTVWTATIREGDCVHQVDEKPRKRSKGTKRYSTMSEEKPSKKVRGVDEGDCIAPAPGLTDQQLMHVAKGMGKEWRIVAISYLGLSKQDLDEIEAAEKDVTMLKFNMLDLWRRRQSEGRDGVQELHQCLKDNDDVPNEVIAMLDKMLQNNSAT